ncbi:MAG: 5'/3'-nucleotidase SurE [Candidatus Krumholzibacteria bacterium]|jgi:5'-nucleotidase|nr:5'/3'-nucleotidase SurE [Candidatus Krumholzibacteria bacterium]MDP6669551.1 5'/3'-nucleotidase SurE [Candidatus Krumholzibacteria bacterium]MDP6797771.1 5'/3'-nucleotidase SurE [Candidatus Krumholzibacteria bacterium]MDP7020887.1 5'/3'-nucleotidase SurE [Candidatus Krumholzibacteria bacterium]
MRVLLTNDDGIYAQGLRALQAELESLCELWVVAPASEQSATSHSLTLETILRRRKLSDRVYSVSGTPADSVLMAFNGVMESNPPDLVISGINHGPNMGEDVHYSGTVAAAIEAAILGIPAMAISVTSFREPNFEAAVQYVSRMVRNEAESLTVPGTLLNVNVPSLPWNEVRGVEVTRLGSRFYGDVIIRKKDPREKEYFWIGGEEPTWEDEKYTDFYTVHREKKISITPLLLDLTNHERLAQMKNWSRELP